jgi:hypothetical protein
MKKFTKVSFFKMLFSTITVAIIFTACGDDPNNDGNHLPTVNISQSNKSVNVGTTVSLDSIAGDIDGDILTYQWSFLSKPNGSTSELTTSRTKETTFLTDKAGEYRVQFVATDSLNAKGKDSVTITAKNGGDVSNSCSSYTNIDEDIKEDRVLDGCYKITRGMLSVSALLTIKAGSQIVFIENGGISVGSGGALKAVGTADKPILFTGEQKSAGYWKGIMFQNSNDTRNEIAYATVEYAGGGNAHGSVDVLGDQHMINRIKLSNIIFRYSASHGFCLEGKNHIDKFENITSTKNKISAGRVDMYLLGKLDTQSNFKGNIGGDYITVEEGDVFENSTWKSLSVPIYFKRSITIHDNVLLTLDAGVELIFDSGKEITTSSLGALKAIGTAKKPILFTGKEHTAGYWQGIEVGSNSINNILHYIIVEYGGSRRAGLYLNTHYSATLKSRVNVKNSIFRHNAEYGIYIYYNKDAIYNDDIESANTFDDNQKGNVKKK